MAKIIEAECRRVGIEDPAFPSPEAERVFFMGDRALQDRAIAKLRWAVVASKAKTMAWAAGSGGALGAVVSLEASSSATALISLIGSVTAAVLAAGNIWNEGQDPFEQNRRVRRAAEKMVGEPVSERVADRLRRAIRF
jgi:hypothetical protein